MPTRIPGAASPAAECTHPSDPLDANRVYGRLVAFTNIYLLDALDDPGPEAFERRYTPFVA